MAIRREPVPLRPAGGPKPGDGLADVTRAGLTSYGNPAGTLSSIRKAREGNAIGIGTDLGGPTHFPEVKPRS